MICISIAQESRRLALVDIHNAAKQCDLIELRLDRFDKAPDVKDLLAHKPKPVIASCRRPQDGGHWQGSEEERLGELLRQAMVDADSVELELDVAAQVRSYPKCKRVIAYANLQETPDDLSRRLRTSLQVQSGRDQGGDLGPHPGRGLAARPTPGQGLSAYRGCRTQQTRGHAHDTGQKAGAPWTYAALERGMETFPGQPTVADLKEVYDYQGIDKETRFVGVTGFGRTETVTTALLNAGLKHLKQPVRCLPLAIGDIGISAR